MKKIISFILCLTMVLAFAAPASAATFTDCADSKNSVAIETLADLGVVAGIGGGLYAPANNLTRAEMVTIIIRALGYDDYVSEASITQFEDVPATHWASGYIAFANSLGIVSGYGNGKFGPNDPVTYDQMITMVVNALGYGHDITGTWPTGHIYKALSLKILDGIKTGSGKATRAEMAQLVYNSLGVTIASVSYNKLFDMYVTNTNTDDTMLKRLDASSTKAVLDYTGACEVGDVTKTGIYSEIYKNKDNEVISASQLEDLITGEATASNKIKVGDTTYAIKASAITADTQYYVNAKKSSAAAITAKETYTLSCEIDGNYITKIYAISTWTPTTTFQITKSNIASLTKAKLNGYTFDTTVTDAIDYNTFVLNGVDDLDDLVVGDVVTLYTYGNSGSSIVRLDVASDIICGTVDKIKTSTTGTTYTIGGTAYSLATGVSALSIGVEYKCYLNAEGKIFKADRVKSAAQNFGIYYAYQTGNAFNDAKVGIYTKDKPTVVSTYTMANTVDTTSLTAISLVTYSFNKSGAISDITSATTATATNLGTSVVKADNNYYRIAKDAVIFTKDTSTGAIDISSVAKIVKNKNIGATEFIVDTDNTIVAMFVDAAYADAETGTGYCVINEVSTIATADGAKTAITGYIDGVAVKDVLCVSDKVTANSHLSVLYKLGYSGDEIKTITKASTPAFTSTITDVDDEFIYDSNNKIYVLDDDVIIYKWTLDTETFDLVDNVEINTVALMYDTDSTPDGIYDVVIYGQYLVIVGN